MAFVRSIILSLYCCSSMTISGPDEVLDTVLDESGGEGALGVAAGVGCGVGSGVVAGVALPHMDTSLVIRRILCRSVSPG